MSEFGSEPIENAEDALRSIKNKFWMEGGCEKVAEIERKAAQCPFCGHQHEQAPRFPDGCAVCGAPKIEWMEERARQVHRKLEDEAEGDGDEDS